MKNDGRFETRKETKRRLFEGHFYASWAVQLEKMPYEELKSLNEDKLKDVNAAYPDTLLWLKSMVLMKMSEYEKTSCNV